MHVTSLFEACLIQRDSCWAHVIHVTTELHNS